MYRSYKHWCRLPMCLFCRFSIDRHTDLERQFNINADDGKITLATPLDRELSVWHNITIIATEISKCWVCSFLPCALGFSLCLGLIWEVVLFLVDYFGIGTFVSKETWNASSQHEITYAVVNYQKVAIYAGRKHFYIQVFSNLIPIIQPLKTMFCVLKYGKDLA